MSGGSFGRPLSKLGEAGATAAEAVPDPDFMKLSRSDFVTLPPLPVAGTRLMSMPSFLAINLTAGVDKALPLKLPGPAAGAAVLVAALAAGAFSSLF